MHADAKIQWHLDWMKDGLVLGPAGIRSYKWMGGSYDLTADSWVPENGDRLLDEGRVKLGPWKWWL